jgi:hypothetical protein
MADESNRSRGASSGSPWKRVGRTGIALVHQGELILPAAGSTAQAEQVEADARTVVHYYFPVEIEVYGDGEKIDQDAIVDRTLELLAEKLRSG